MYQTDAYGGCHYNSLYKCIPLASSSKGISMQIYKIKFPKWFEHLSNVPFGKIEVQRSYIEPAKSFRYNTSNSIITYCMAPRVDV